MLSVKIYSTPFFINYTFISVNFEKIKIIIYESIHFKHVITFIPYSLRTIQNYWRQTSVLSISIEREIEEAKRLVEFDEVATMLHQLTLLSFDSEVGDKMNAHEYLNYEMEFNLNNPYEPTDEEFLDIHSLQHQKIDVDEVKVDVVEEVVGFGVAERSLETLKKYFE